MRNPLEVGERVLRVKRLRREKYPRGAGVVSTLRGHSALVTFDPPVPDPKAKGCFIYEATITRAGLLTEEEAREYFICRHCAGKGCWRCGNSGGHYVSLPIVKRFLGLE